jgi:hypothetical protein
MGRIVRELREKTEDEGADAPIGAAWSTGAVETAFPDETDSPDEIELEAVADDEPEPIGVESAGDSAGLDPAGEWGAIDLTDEVEVDEPPEPADDEDVTYGLSSGGFEEVTILPEGGAGPAEEDEPAGEPGAPVDAGDWVPQERWDTFADPAAAETEPASAQADWAREPAGEPVGGTEDDPSVEEILELVDASDDFEGAESGEPESEVDTPEFDAPEPEAEEPGMAAAAVGDDTESDDESEAGDPVMLEVETIETTQVEVELDPETAQAIVAENLPDDDEESASAWRSPAEVVTETMAEVYAAQGLTERSVEVYRQLRELRPDDDRITARLAELEQMLASPEPAPAESVPAEDREAWLEKVESAWTGGEGAVGGDDDTLYGWRQQREESGAPEARAVGSYFRSLLSWRPEGAADVETEPAIDDGPGSAVVEDPEAEEEILLVDEIEPSGEAPAGGSASGGSVEAAFDEWFGGDPEERGGKSPPASASGGSESGASESEEDLEMFRTWLQSLKK